MSRRGPLPGSSWPWPCTVRDARTKLCGSPSKHSLTRCLATSVHCTTMPPRSLRTQTPQLHVEAELHHVAVLHDVLLALHAGLALGARLGDGTAFDEVVERDDLGLDE